MNKKYCYFCKNYMSSYCCGYEDKSCRVYGSLDIDQKERHPDITANTCKDYEESEEKIKQKKDLYDYLLKKEKK